MLLVSTLLLALPTTNLSPCTLGLGSLLPPRVREGPPRVPIVCLGALRLAFVPSLNLPGREHGCGEAQGHACLQRPLGIMPILVPASVYPHMRPMPSSLQAKPRKLKDADTKLMDTDKDPHGMM